MRFILLVALLVAQAPAPQPAPYCTVSDQGPAAGTKHYFCLTAGGGWSLVPKPWFKAHCKASSYAGQPAATCDAYADSTDMLAPKDAAKPGIWKKRIETAAITGAVVLIVAACVAGGGCAAMGGG